ncbi:hypothetical protein LHT11_09595, partial [Acetobacter indonesiensis]|uniref:hypothetical protein n=1 Tax=Acetobacter indonesiensis TaxID=104101 RepID=UPI001F17DC6A
SKQPSNLADLLKPAKTSTASVKRFLGHQNNTVNTIPKITKKPRKPTLNRTKPPLNTLKQHKKNQNKQKTPRLKNGGLMPLRLKRKEINGPRTA